MALLLGMEPTRANRLLGTLAAVGLAEQGTDRKYRPGPGVHVLAAQSLQGSHLLASALPHLETLREEIAVPKAVVALGVLWQRQVCYLFHARSGMALAKAIGTHQIELAGYSSIGVLFLALSNDQNEVALAQAEVSSLRRPPPAPLDGSVNLARQNGYGRLNFSQGVISLAVAVGNPAIAGLAVSGHLEEDQIAPTVARLRQSAALITQTLDTPANSVPVKINVSS